MTTFGVINKTRGLDESPVEAFGWSLSFSPEVEQNEVTGFRRVLGEEKLPEIRDYSAITSSKLYCLSTGTQYYCYYGKTTQQPRRTPVDWCLCFSADPSKKEQDSGDFMGRLG